MDNLKDNKIMIQIATKIGAISSNGLHVVYGDAVSAKEHNIEIVKAINHNIMVIIISKSSAKFIFLFLYLQQTPFLQQKIVIIASIDVKNKMVEYVRNKPVSGIIKHGMNNNIDMVKTAQ